MRIFLDFDRTVFDTEAWYRALEREAVQGSGGRDIVLFRMSTFLYSDVVPFFTRQHSHEYHLVTFGAREVQEPKVRLSGIGAFCERVQYVEEGTKAPVIGRMCRKDEHAIFIDDSMEHLAATAQQCPHVVCIRMRRKGAKGSEQEQTSFPEITSFDVFEDVCAPYVV